MMKSDYSLNFKGKSSFRPRRRNSKSIVIISILLLLGTYLFFSRFFSSQTNPQNTSGKKEETKKQTETALSSTLTDRIEKLVENAPGTYSIYIRDIKSGKEYGLHEKTIITAASVNKIPILATLYHLAGIGEIDLDKTITPQPTDIQDYGTGSIRYDPPGTHYSLKTLARLMMEKSDNTAAHLLGQVIIGFPKIQEFIDTWGLTQTNMETNKTSAKDMSILLLKMYNKEITTPSLTSEMLGFMEKSDYDDRIPAGIPDGTKIYHKTGDDIGKIHDVGIVDLDNTPYYVGILTTDIKDEEETKRRLAQISKVVYEFMKGAGR